MAQGTQRGMAQLGSNPSLSDLEACPLSIQPVLLGVPRGAPNPREQAFGPGTRARASVASCLLLPSDLVFPSVKWDGWVRLWAGVCPHPGAFRRNEVIFVWGLERLGRRKLGKDKSPLSPLPRSLPAPAPVTRQGQPCLQAPETTMCQQGLTQCPLLSH